MNNVQYNKWYLAAFFLPFIAAPIVYWINRMPGQDTQQTLIVWMIVYAITLVCIAAGLRADTKAKRDGLLLAVVGLVIALAAFIQ